MAKKIDWRKEYSKERARLQKPFSKLKKAGYVPEMELPTLKEIDKKSKFDIKKATLKLRKIKGKSVEKQTVVDAYTGEVITLKQAREKIKDEKHYPTIGTLQAVLRKLEELPTAKLVYSITRKKLYWVDIESKASVLYRIVQDLVSEIGEKEADALYFRNQEQIFNLLDEIPPASKEEDIQQSFVNLSYYLSDGRSITGEEGEELSDMGGYYETT